MTKLVVMLTLLGLLAFDGIAVVSTTFRAEDHAGIAASQAAEAYANSKSVQQAYNTAAATAGGLGDSVEAETFTIDPASGHVALRLHSEATTLWLHRIAPLRKYTHVLATGESSPSS